MHDVANHVSSVYWIILCYDSNSAGRAQVAAFACRRERMMPSGMAAIVSC